MHITFITYSECQQSKLLGTSEITQDFKPLSAGGKDILYINTWILLEELVLSLHSKLFPNGIKHR